MIVELAKRKAQLKSDIKKYAAEKNYKQLDGADTRCERWIERGKIACMCCYTLKLFTNEN